MRKETYFSNGTTWERITRNKAEKAYNEGHRITLCPVNIRPRSSFCPPIPVTNSCGRTFRAIVNEFEAYNCYGETGKYAKFFMGV